MALPLDEVISAWKKYLSSAKDWQTLVEGVSAKETGCGPVYELENPIDRPNESFAIVDMRNIKVTEPHYHANNETEIYFGITGTGRVVVGGQESEISPGSVTTTPPNTAHFTFPKENLVIAAVNTPPFNSANYIALTKSEPAMKFDQEQFERLSESNF